MQEGQVLIGDGTTALHIELTTLKEPSTVIVGVVPEKSKRRPSVTI